MLLERGQTISHYRIEQKIGEGGMGVVYEAEDTRLGRRVALKVLSADVSADAGRRARFEREARAIAALNHPNIVTLHSVEEVDGLCFLTMELVQGSSLTHNLVREGLPLGKLLDMSLGIADALVAAHRQGIVHRDLKPDNIMVTSEGRIKILDFGLAKARETALQGMGTVLPTASITEEGRILGTVAYMSPEQAEGRSLDHRSDIFSFGVVLFEMATGRRPFQGETAISTISSILKDTPPPVQQINSSMPVQLGRIVRRCLSKELERRYQSTDDLRNELRELKEESDSGELTAERLASAPQGATSAVAAAPSSGKRPRSRLAIWAVAAALIVVAIGAAWILKGRGAATGPPPATPSAALAAIQMSRATTDGKVSEAAISPDGRYLAYVRKDGKSFSLRLRQVVTGDEVQVVAASGTELYSPAFSGDGNFLYYVSQESGQLLQGYASRVSVLGGTPRRIVDRVWSVAPSPDGTSLALTGGNLNRSFLSVSSSEGDSPRELIFRQGKDHFDSSPAWSSDSRSLAIVSHRFGEPQQIVLIDAATGKERPLPIPSLRSLNDVRWLPGNGAWIVSGSDRPVNQRGSAQVWEVSTSGALQPITRDLNSYSGIGVTADGSTVAAVQEEVQSGIAIAEVRDGIAGAFTELLPVSASRPGDTGIAWLDDHRLAHGSLQGTIRQIFITDTNSKTTRVLTSGPTHHSPFVSRDGRVMVVARADEDQDHIYRVDPETGREQRLTEGQFDSFPVISPDGQWVVYSTAADLRKLMKVPATGGSPVALTQGAAFPFGISSDNKEAYGIEVSPSDAVESKVIPMDGGESRPIQGIPATSRFAQLTRDGRFVTYLNAREGADEIWNQPLRGGAPHKVARFEGQEIQFFAWSPDGTRLAIVKVSRSGDVVLLKRSMP